MNRFQINSTSAKDIFHGTLHIHRVVCKRDYHTENVVAHQSDLTICQNTTEKFVCMVMFNPLLTGIPPSYESSMVIVTLVQI